MSAIQAACGGCNGPYAKDETGRWIGLSYTSGVDYWHETTIVTKNNYDSLSVLWRRCTERRQPKATASLSTAMKEAL